MRKLALAVIALSLAGGAVCAQQAKPAGPKKLDPCALVSKAEIQEAAGMSVADGKPNPQNASVCDYKVGDMGAFSFLVTQSRPGETPDRIMAELNKRKMKAEPVEGIGDRSFFASVGYGMIQLNSFKGSNYIIATVLIPGMPEAKGKEIAGKVMKKVLAKL